MRFKYIDDLTNLTVLELVLIGGLLADYNFKQQVASDIGIDDNYVPATSLTTHNEIDQIAKWTVKNMMKLKGASQIK